MFRFFRRRSGTPSEPEEPPKREMTEMMKRCWSEMEINLSLSPDAEETFEEILQRLFSSRGSALDPRVLDSFSSTLSRILTIQLRRQGLEVLPSAETKNISRIAREESSDIFVVAAQWVIQKTMLELMKRKFKLESKNKIDPEYNKEGYIALTRNGSMLIAGPIELRSVILRGSDNFENLPLRHYVYLRIPARRGGTWGKAFEGFDVVLKKPVQIGQEFRSSYRINHLEDDRKRPFPNLRTSELVELLLIPNDQLENLHSIVDVSRLFTSVVLGKG